jgi:hypothetical protein
VLVEETAKEALGSYKWGWPRLAESTIERKARGDSPLLETGELRESIEHVVMGRSGHVGTNAFQAEWMEFGTTNIGHQEAFRTLGKAGATRTLGNAGATSIRLGSTTNVGGPPRNSESSVSRHCPT